MNKPNIIGICFAIGYLFACLIASNFPSEGGWNGFLCFILAFPFSILSAVISSYIGESFGIFLILNSLWWYFLIRLFYYIKDKSKYIDQDDGQ